MSLKRSSIGVGSKIWFAREQQKIVALNANTVTTRSMRNGLLTVISIADLLTSEGFSTDPSGIVEDTSPEALHHAIPGGVPELAVKNAKLHLKHILEAATGYRSGNAMDA